MGAVALNFHFSGESVLEVQANVDFAISSSILGTATLTAHARAAYHIRARLVGQALVSPYMDVLQVSTPGPVTVHQPIKQAPVLRPVPAQVFVPHNVIKPSRR